MSAIKAYSEAKRTFEYSASWASLLGQPYRGGGGGTGYLVSVKLVGGESAPTIYHQYSDGAKNYHLCPAELIPHLEAAIKARFPELLADALKRHSEGIAKLAQAAVAEHAELMAAAGLTEATGSAS